MHGGPPCSSYVWLNRGTSKRSASDVSGDMSEPSVSMANEILGVNSLSLVYLIMRC